MNRPSKWHLVAMCVAMVFGSVAIGAGTTQPMVVNWSGKDINGAEVKVPDSERPSVVAFVRADQDQSKESLKQIQTTVPDPKAAQVIVVLSGPLAREQAKGVAADLPKGWPVVADPEFDASGKMSIHVWPTVLVIRPDGAQVAHLAGMPQTFATDLQAYLESAAGKLDDTKLQQRLTTHEVVTDTPAQAGARHLQVAHRLLEAGHPDEARAELAEGLKHAPDDPMLGLTLARVYVLLNQPKDAIETLDKLSADSAPAWQTSLIRGRALIALQKWSEAKSILPEALKLNPDPAEAHYLMGLCYQHDQDWPHAAEQFRLAFERSESGRKLAITAQPAK